MQRMGMVIGIEADKIDEYKELHANCWPEIRAGLHDANIRNYSIWLHEDERLLFSYWEYHGKDFEADMRSIADQEITQRWWALCSPCQKKVPSHKKGEHWSIMEEVFYQA